MKKILCITLIFGSVLYLSYTANAVTESIKFQQKTDTLKNEVTDPVCQMKVKAGSTRTSVYGKVVYGFCSDGCKKSFIKNPYKYLKNR